MDVRFENIALNNGDIVTFLLFWKGNRDEISNLTPIAAPLLEPDYDYYLRLHFNQRGKIIGWTVVSSSAPMPDTISFEGQDYNVSDLDISYPETSLFGNPSFIPGTAPYPFTEFLKRGGRIAEGSELNIGVIRVKQGSEEFEDNTIILGPDAVGDYPIQFVPILKPRSDGKFLVVRITEDEGYIISYEVLDDPSVIDERLDSQYQIGSSDAQNIGYIEPSARLLGIATDFAIENHLDW